MEQQSPMPKNGYALHDLKYVLAKTRATFQMKENDAHVDLELK